MVKFTDDAGLMEEALDSGGPMPNTSHLIVKVILFVRFLQGCKSVCPNIAILAFLAAEDNEYFHIGRMIAVSIVHGGPGPCCLSPNFFLYLIGKVKTIEDIPDDEVNKSLLEVIC